MKEWKEAYGEHPVGTGPFKFVSWEPNQKIVLEANPAYWGGAPKSKKVIYAVIAENSVRVQRLRAGEVHIIDGVPPGALDSIKGDASCRVMIEPGMNFSYLAINCEKPPFDRPEVRQAIAMAIDKPELLKLAYRGIGQTGPNALPPTIWGYNEKVADYPYDPAKAKAAIEAAGIGGKEIDLYVMPNPRAYVPDPASVGAVVKQRLEAIGLKPRILSPVWEGGVYLGELKQGKHDIALVGWITDNGDPDNFLFTLFHSSAIPDQNHARYRSKEFDDLVVRAQKEPDQAKRSVLYAQAQEVMRKDTPVVPLAYLPNIAATRANVEGFALHPMGLIRLKDASAPGSKGDVLVYARGADSKKLDPQAIEDGESVNVVTQIFDTLVAFESKGTKVEPALATSWTSSSDGMVWTFKMRSGVKFHDGTVCDAAAVAANFNRYLKK